MTPGFSPSTDAEVDASAREYYARIAEEAAPGAPPKKRRNGTSPTARTLAECRKRGWIAQVVERYNPHARVLQDLFGVIDVVAIATVPADDKYGLPARTVILGIQTTGGSGGAHAARRDKILAEPRALAWCNAGGRVELWSWSKRGDRGKRKIWTLRVETYDEMVAARGGAT